MDMNRKRYIVIVVCLIWTSFSLPAVPVSVEIVEVKKIWDEAPHNAFTDLVRWKDSFYCAFREGRGHVSTDGRIRILESSDADTWNSTALISLEDFDLRDAHLSVAADDRLMLTGGAAPREKDNQSAPTGTFVSFSKDGRQWTKPKIVVEPGRWLWCVTWHEGKAYGVSYTAGKSSDRYLDMLVSIDGIHYTKHVPRLFEQGYPNEVTLRFDSDGICYALVRRDRHGDEPSSALLGVSRPDYKQWQWKDLGSDFNGFGGPNFIQIPDGHWFAAGRMHDGGAHTALCYLDVENGKMTKLVKLPSGGDTSYPGMVWHNNMLYISYYSSHKNKTSIYLTKVKIRPESMSEAGDTDPAKAFVSAGEILKVWEDNYTHFESMKVSYTERVLEAIPPADNPNRFDSMVRLMHVERVEQEQRFHIRYSCDEEGFNKPESIIEGSFDGKITREYIASQKSGMIIAGMIGRNTENMNRLKAYMLLDKPHLVRKNPSGPFEMYWIEDPNSKPLLSRIISRAISNSRVSVLPNLDYVAGQMCHVLEIYNKKGLALKLWLAQKRGMLLLKKQHFENDKPVNDIVVEQIDCVKTNEGTVWYPKKAYRMAGNENLGKIKSELMTHEFVPNIQVDENTFRFDFPKGTRIHDRIRGIWGVDLPEEPPSLVGKVLPPLEDLNIKLDAVRIKDKMIFVCFFDIEQRPSRNCIMQMSKRAQELKAKDIAAIVVNTSKLKEQILNEWIKNNEIPFPVGIIQGDVEKTRFNWGVKSLPWLIMTDRKHVVTAEGFGLDKLDEKISLTNDGK
jgi:hypothetical protein